jgi:hypothetical protein
MFEDHEDPSPEFLVGMTVFHALCGRVTYAQQAVFSLVSLPFSFKLVWAPIVDSTAFPSVGRRKSWLVPVQVGDDDDDDDDDDVDVDDNDSQVGVGAHCGLDGLPSCPCRWRMMRMMMMRMMMMMMMMIMMMMIVKLVWAPIVDSTAFPSVGRRKSWLVPVQVGGMRMTVMMVVVVVIVMAWNVHTLGSLILNRVVETDRVL